MSNSGKPEVSVVIPTLNEAENLRDLLPRLLAALEGAGMAAEVVVADDLSPDGTAAVAGSILGDRGVVLERTGPRGLAFAVADGFAASSGGIICVMDADLSHPPEIVPALVEAVRGGADLAVGSRYVEGGSTKGWPLARRLVSRVACLFARPVVGIRDATSGFFCVKRSVIEGLDLGCSGFKIGLEVFARGRYGKAVEVPYEFVDRKAGKSKMGSGVILGFLFQVARLTAGRIRRGA